MSKKIIIIGSGIAGLSVALRLSRKGFKVKVLEKNSYVGGKVSEFKAKGYRFDMGPSLFTMPELVDELADKNNLSDKIFFKYLKLDIACRYFFNDGVLINGYVDKQKFANEASIKTSVDPLKVIRYLKYIKFIYNTTSKIFIEKSLHKFSTYFSFQTLLAFLKIPFLSIFKTMNATNITFLKDSKIVQIFNRFATYNGSDPYIAPGILNVIAHLEFNKGVYLPKNGMRSIVEFIYQLCLNSGVLFELNSQVTQISIDKNKVKGVYVNKVFYPADIVVSNIDIYYVYNNLLDSNHYLPSRFKISRSSSAIIFYWGINKVFEKLDLHNIFFAQDYKREFQEIKLGNSIWQDPTIYVNITSKYISNDAPNNCENWFVMINVSHDTGQDWNSLINDAKKIIIKKLNRVLDCNIEENIEVENFMGPKEIEKNTGSFNGALYGTSSNSKMSAFLRHSNFSSKIKDLYFCGGTVHPGGGIPLALNSAKIVANEIN
tara:strand:+ start:600 stop:2063 length:1464 start_codon:yes stop_codon:yes gene_type:complete